MEKVEGERGKGKGLKKTLEVEVIKIENVQDELAM